MRHERSRIDEDPGPGHHDHSRNECFSEGVLGISRGLAKNNTTPGGELGELLRCFQFLTEKLYKGVKAWRVDFAFEDVLQHRKSPAGSVSQCPLCTSGNNHCTFLFVQKVDECQLRSIIFFSSKTANSIQEDKRRS